MTANSLTPTESVVSAIWAELLQLPLVEPEHDFFELGGDSMMMMITLFRVSEELKIELPPGSITNAPTLREFCTLIDEAGSAELELV